jgi:flagellar basal body-associated protein FliL
MVYACGIRCLIWPVPASFTYWDQFMKMSRLFYGLLSLWAASALASGGGDKEIPEGINYIPITPALIVNYGGPGPRVKYIKVELSIRTENATDAKTVMHHLPLIRDRLISIFSGQTEESLSSGDGKEKLRLLALDEINRVVHVAEYGSHAEATDAKNAADKSDDKSDKKSDKADKKSAKEKSDKAKKKDDPPEAKVVKGPASDLFFNNFVVQK